MLFNKGLELFFLLLYPLDMIRAINLTTDYRTNFSAHFISDSKGLLHEVSTQAKYNYGITLDTLNLAERFHNSNNHQLEIVDIKEGRFLQMLKIRNITTGKVGYFGGNKNEGYFWDNVLNSLLGSGKKGFYEK